MKVGIYCRLSEEDRIKAFKGDDSGSIKNQKSLLTEYATKQQWEIFDIYSDDDYTGADRNRPEFVRLIKDAEQHKFDIVLCKTQSRFTRELEIVEKYIHGLFPIWGIRFVSVVDNADTENKGNKKSRQINGLINEWYLEDLSDNIKAVLKNKHEQGLFTGSFAPYGYKKDPNKKGHLIIDEEASEVVKLIFNLFIQGWGKKNIAKFLNEKNYPNPTEYKIQKGIRWNRNGGKNSGLWKYYTVSDILTNEVYVGNMVQNKYGSVSYKTKKCKPRPKSEWIRVEDTHEPIIDKEVWDKTQSLLKERTKPCYNGKIGKFSKKTKCMYCGYTLMSGVNRGYRYLRCPTFLISHEACQGSFIPQRVLEDIILKELNEIIKISFENADPDKLADKIDINYDITTTKQYITDNIKNINKQIDEYAEALKNLYLDKVKGAITQNDFDILKKEFSKSKSTAEDELNLNQEKLIQIEKIAESDDRKKQILEKYKNVTELTTEMVQELIDHIEIGKRENLKDTYPIVIYWNF